MSSDRHPPAIAALLRELGDHHVDFVIAGSVAVQAWGVDIGEAGDLDIVSDLRVENLKRLAECLGTIEAVAHPVTGTWVGADGEMEWQEFDDDDPRRLQPLLLSKMGRPPS